MEKVNFLRLPQEVNILTGLKVYKGQEHSTMRRTCDPSQTSAF